MDKSVNKEKAKQVKPTKKISEFFWNTLLVVNIIVWASLVITFLMNDCNIVRANVLGYRPCFVLSQSMEPTLDTHALTVCKMNEDKYEVGDIVVYEQEIEGANLLIIHRIIDQYEDGSFQTKGDNNPSEDPWTVNQDQIVGKVVGICNGVAPIIDKIFY